jgi:hypothetical protein
MALSIPTSSGGGDGGQFLPIVKYDARAGRVNRIDREQGVDGWMSHSTDITTKFSAVMDLENLEIGWMLFAAGTPPDYRLVPNGQDAGPAPTDKHKRGVRVLMKLAKDAGGDVRELTTSARTALGAFSALHDAYLAGLAENPGKLPVVKMIGTKAVTSGQGAKKSTNYAPEFTIDGWVARPADLQHVARASSAPAGPPAFTPAATGSRVVPPPAKQMAAASANDWG